MSRESTTVLSCVVLAGIAASAASAFVITRGSTDSALVKQAGTPSSIKAKGQRNLALQPEALRVSRRLGKRFEVSSRAISTSVGNLTFAGTQQAITIVRRQTESGEQIELLIGGRSLTWNDQEGIKTIAGVPTDTERLLLERFLLDSPDQFVLAQLRGASYFTVAQNVRPNDAVDGYTGASWTQVRVNDLADHHPRLTSRWRIFYINSATGLIDRVVSEQNGQTVQAEITEWIEQNGERSPAHIVWSADGQTIMDYHLTAVSIAVTKE